MESRKVTQLDYAILGLLSQGPLTGYKIRMTFENTALGNFSSSPGTIYPALKRLAALKLIDKKTKGAKRNGQTVMSITRMGTGVLKA